MRGIVDAVYADEAPGAPEGGVVIVDWKTGRRPTGARRRARDVQLDVYRIAWHERTGIPLESIRTVFHYVAEGRDDEVTRHESREQLARLLAVAPEPENGVSSGPAGRLR